MRPDLHGLLVLAWVLRGIARSALRSTNTDTDLDLLLSAPECVGAVCRQHIQTVLDHSDGFLEILAHKGLSASPISTGSRS